MAVALAGGLSSSLLSEEDWVFFTGAALGVVLGAVFAGAFFFAGGSSSSLLSEDEDDAAFFAGVV